MGTYKQIASSLMFGISIGAFVGCYYGWSLLSANSDYVTATKILFMTTKAWMMGISVAGFFSLVSYVAMYFDVAIKKEKTQE